MAEVGIPTDTILPDNALILNYGGELILLRLKDVVMRDGVDSVKTYQLEAVRWPADEIAAPPAKPLSHFWDLAKGTKLDITKIGPIAPISVPLSDFKLKSYADDFLASLGYPPADYSELLVHEQEMETRHENRIRQL